MQLVRQRPHPKPRHLQPNPAHGQRQRYALTMDVLTMILRTVPLKTLTVSISVACANGLGCNSTSSECLPTQQCFLLYRTHQAIMDAGLGYNSTHELRDLCWSALHADDDGTRCAAVREPVKYVWWFTVHWGSGFCSMRRPRFAVTRATAAASPPATPPPPSRCCPRVRRSAMHETAAKPRCVRVNKQHTLFGFIYFAYNA